MSPVLRLIFIRCTSELSAVTISAVIDPPSALTVPSDAAATTLARISPEAARLIRPVLAHNRFGTAERHYIHAGSIEAGRDYAAVVGRIKRQVR